VRPENGVESTRITRPDAFLKLPLARVVCVQVG
jgi:hypothetical protein